MARRSLFTITHQELEDFLDAHLVEVPDGILPSRDIRDAAELYGRARIGMHIERNASYRTLAEWMRNNRSASPEPYLYRPTTGDELVGMQVYKGFRLSEEAAQALWEERNE